MRCGAILLAARHAAGVSAVPGPTKVEKEKPYMQEKENVGCSYAPLSAGIGKGSVIPLTYNYIKPVYMVPGYMKMFVVMFFWFQANTWTHFIMCAVLIFSLHGGWSGHVPPDPHDLHH